MEKRDTKRLLDAIRAAAGPRIWSRAVDWAKSGELRLESESETELSVQLVHPRLREPARVDIWPGDLDGTCSCSDPDSPCVHLVAAVILLNQRGEAPMEAAPKVVHTFERRGNALSFDRFVVHGSEKQRVSEPLAMLLGGIRSGRIPLPSFVAQPEELAIDTVLGMKKHGLLDPHTMRLLIPALSRVPHVTLDGEPVRCRAAELEDELCLEVDRGRFRFRWTSEMESGERFEQGVVKIDGELAVIGRPALLAGERAVIERSEPLSFEELARFVSLNYGTLSRKVDIRWPDDAPRLLESPPDVVFQMDSLPGGDLTVKPIIVYGEPAAVEIERGEVRFVRKDAIPVRDPEAERALSLSVREKDLLIVGETRRLTGADASAMAGRLAGRRTRGSTGPELELVGKLAARPEFSRDGLDLRFEITTDRGVVRADPAEVFEAWRSGAGTVPLLDNAGIARVPDEWLERFSGVLEELLRAQGSTEMGASAKMIIEARIAGEIGIEPPPDLAALERALREHTGLSEPNLPPGFLGRLRDYQKQGVAWLQTLSRHGLGGILADDMGLGKTLQALCVIEPPALVVAPTSVLFSWRDHVSRHRPNLSINEYHGARRRLDDSDVTITSYGLLRGDADALAGREWASVILDEAHVIKNADSQIARAAFRLRAGFRVSLTGTPLENRALDIWSQAQFVNPGVLGPRSDFEARFGRADPESAAELAAKIRPFLLRRRKEEVLTELPERTETVLTCELSEEERKLYETLLAAARGEVLKALGEGRGAIAALELLLRLRQACCHQALLPGREGVLASSKLELLMESLEQSIENGHRALIFSQWTSLLDKVSPLLDRRGIGWSRIDGSTVNREKVVREFQDPSGPPVMLISLKAGGLGLTLTAADHVYILDPWWNPAVEDQASARAHRIGQHNPVLVHRLVARDTVEERILALQASKRALADEVVGRGGAAELMGEGLTKEEILGLL